MGLDAYHVVRCPNYLHGCLPSYFRAGRTECGGNVLQRPTTKWEYQRLFRVFKFVDLEFSV